jgi:hypothetical protein
MDSSETEDTMSDAEQNQEITDVDGHRIHGLHSPCPVCGYATRYKQFGPVRCACNRYWTKEAMEAHKRYQEGTYDGAHQHVAEYGRSQGTQ